MPHPIRAAFTVPFGAEFGAPRAGGRRRHQGTDYHCPIGTPIYGTGDAGRVASIGYAPDPNIGLGHYVVVTYQDGRRTIDAHMRSRSGLGIGQVVNSTTLLGHVGITGNAVNADPPGSHDHHECRVNGVLVNPHTLYAATTPAGSGSLIPEGDDMPLTEAEMDRIALKVWTFALARVDGSGQDFPSDILRFAGARIVALQGEAAAIRADLNYINQGTANPASLVKIADAITDGPPIQLTQTQLDRFTSSVDAVLADDFARVGAVTLTPPPT